MIYQQQYPHMYHPCLPAHITASMQHKSPRWNSFPANCKIHHSLWKPNTVNRSLATGPYPQPDESSLHPPMQHLNEYMCKCKRQNKKIMQITHSNWLDWLKLVTCLSMAKTSQQSSLCLPSLYRRMKFHVTEESETLIHRFLQITQKYL
jgi:hypothetical protein